MKIQAHLISGAGNTFHVINEMLQSSPTKKWTIFEKKEFARKMCQIKKADGAIFLKKGKVFSWDFYNNDGSDAEMCGNATRCVGFYLSEIISDADATWTLNTIAGPIQIQKIDSQSFRITMTAIKILKSEKGFFCDTGVPHLVQEVADFSEYKKFKNEAIKLRNHKEFEPKGTNVTYVQLLNDKSNVKAVSFERGVEDFTEACGTGAMAAAAFNLMKRGSLQTQVEMPGGTLMMNLAELAAPIMIGPATLIGKYEYEY